jgi:hypothetical protein
MVEINRLCRIIGTCNQQLYGLQHPIPALARIHLMITGHKPIVIAIVAVLLIALYFVRKRQGISDEV